MGGGLSGLFVSQWACCVSYVAQVSDGLAWECRSAVMAIAMVAGLAIVVCVIVVVGS